jgi:hypothetical protein
LLQFPFNKSPQISCLEIWENAKQFL